jgi:hypothetical protein
MLYRMPICGMTNAPKFDSTTDNLTEFIDTYEQLADEAGLQGLDPIHDHRSTHLSFFSAPITMNRVLAL